MTSPKFFKFVTDEKESKQLHTIYNALPKRQKVKWRKAMHRAFKEKTLQGVNHD